jgi:hypothetical protein
VPPFLRVSTVHVGVSDLQLTNAITYVVLSYVVDFSPSFESVAVRSRI